MGSGDQGGAQQDDFPGHRVYPDAAVVFSWRPEPLEDEKSRCLAVLDTNVLAVPYAVGSRSLGEIARTYRSLVGEDRLVVPGQVAREFARVRAIKLGELQKQLSDKRSAPARLQTGRYPLLETTPEYTEALEFEAQINRLVAEYRDAIGRVTERIRQWAWSDPVGALYGELFGGAAVVDPPLDQPSMEADLRWRQEHKVPPGYKDAAKDDRGIGDLLIWHTILWLGRERRQSVLFVTGDEKADWWHRSDKATLFPRHELVEEFRRVSGGRSFYMLGFSEFLDLYGVDEDVVAEVRRQEQERPTARHGSNALTIRDGEVVVVRHAGRYGAVQALRQTLEVPPDGSSPWPTAIDYRWWYQPDGSGSFANSSVQTGTARAEEGGSTVPMLRIGPIVLEWSIGSNGSGYVYFGPSSSPSDEYELAHAGTAEVSQVDVDRLVFVRGPGPAAG